MDNEDIDEAAIIHLSAVISDRVDRRYGSVRAFLLDVLAEAHACEDHEDCRGMGYRSLGSFFHRWQKRDADRVDIREGVQEGRMPADKYYREDPTGEAAVRHIMRGLLA